MSRILARPVGCRYCDHKKKGFASDLLLSKYWRMLVPGGFHHDATFRLQAVQCGRSGP